MIALHNSPEKALQLEAALVSRFINPATDYVLEFWTTDQCLVVPGSLKKQAKYSVACTELAQSGWPVVLRKTGGGVTPQGPGILNVALAYAPDPVEKPTITGVYQMFCAPLIELVAQLGCQASTGCVAHCFCDGAYNIVVDGKKVMGTAQHWTRVRSAHSRKIVFAHALILLDADLAASVDAVNRLYRACAMDSCIEQDAHINLQALVSSRDQSIDQSFDQSGVIDILSGLYRDELVALTG